MAFPVSDVQPGTLAFTMSESLEIVAAATETWNVELQELIMQGGEIRSVEAFSPPGTLLIVGQTGSPSIRCLTVDCAMVLAIRLLGARREKNTCNDTDLAAQT
jgi:hypothetical protein